MIPDFSYAFLSFGFWQFSFAVVLWSRSPPHPHSARKKPEMSEQLTANFIYEPLNRLRLNIIEDSRWSWCKAGEGEENKHEIYILCIYYVTKYLIARCIFYPHIPFDVIPA